MRGEAGLELASLGMTNLLMRGTQLKVTMDDGVKLLLPYRTQTMSTAVQSTQEKTPRCPRSLHLFPPPLYLFPNHPQLTLPSELQDHLKQVLLRREDDEQLLLCLSSTTAV